MVFGSTLVAFVKISLLVYLAPMFDVDAVSYLLLQLKSLLGRHGQTKFREVS